MAHDIPPVSDQSQLMNIHRLMTKAGSWEHRSRQAEKELNEARYQLHLLNQIVQGPIPPLVRPAPAPTTGTEPRPVRKLQNQRIAPRPQTPQEDEEQAELMRETMGLVATIVESTAELASRYPANEEQLQVQVKRRPKATRPIDGISVDWKRVILQHPRAPPPGLQHCGGPPNSGGASSSGLVRVEHEDTGGGPGEKVGEDKATADQRLDDQGLSVPLPSEKKSHAEETAKEMAEVVLREDDQTVETVQEAASEVNSHPPTEEPAADKDNDDLKNIVLDENEEPILAGEKQK